MKATIRRLQLHALFLTLSILPKQHHWSAIASEAKADR